ncbi:MAG: hypothetical protein U5K75_00100 [Ahrensia sp.]|nr:hypothetical protein [Ahrensia sp.]
MQGEPTPAIYLNDNLGDSIAASSATAAHWADFAARIAAAINDLPSIRGGGNRCCCEDAPGSAYELKVTFGGQSTGQEYDLVALVVNTAVASSLPSHTQIGETKGEPLISVARGWPSGATLAQDRLCYYGLKSERGFIMQSRTAEYFDLNIKAAADTGAILDRPRGSGTSEEVAAYKASAISARVYQYRRLLCEQPCNFTQ